jgi:hypothetical protein
LVSLGQLLDLHLVGVDGSWLTWKKQYGLLRIIPPRIVPHASLASSRANGSKLSKISSTSPCIAPAFLGAMAEGSEHWCTCQRYCRGGKSVGRSTWYDHARLRETPALSQHASSDSSSDSSFDVSAQHSGELHANELETDPVLDDRPRKKQRLETQEQEEEDSDDDLDIDDVN